MMICCDLCDGWYHAECVGISVGKAEAMRGYKCKACGGNMDQEVVPEDPYFDSDDDVVSPLPIDPRLQSMSSVCMFGIGLGVQKGQYN